MQEPVDGELEALLEYIHERRNFDFRGYKRASLGRRIQKRMQAIGVEGYKSYQEVLEANPGEFAELFNTILINVTGLMRDREAWDGLIETAIPAIAQSTAPDDPIRVWSAGCASGEEAYSLAIVFAEAVGHDRFRQAVKIYATDADDEALVAARHGRYQESVLLEALGEETAHRYFDFEDGVGAFRSDLRSSLIFGRHDLVQDPPISRLDLVVCRNTLMYFTSPVQLNILATFHFALNPGGYLFLGKSEAMVTGSDLFETMDLRHRIFRKDGTVPDPVPLPTLAAVRSIGRSDGALVAETVVEHSPVAQIMVDADTNVVLTNRQARKLFSIGSAEVGRPLRDVVLSHYPVDIRTPVERALRKRQEVVVHDVVCDFRPDSPLAVDVLITPVEPGGALIAFVDVTRYQHLRDELEDSRRELEAAYEELQSAVEELETTNEELQSTNEELETTNEELHSTNEELETMNEELQLTNEELETINDELRDRSNELDQLNAFLQSILEGLQSAVIVIDADMKVQAWNRQAEDLWGLRRDEVLEQHLLSLDIGFPVDSLRPAIRSCLAGRSEREVLTLPAVNRLGRPVHCSVSVSCLGADPPSGILILMDCVGPDETGLPERGAPETEAEATT